MPVGGAGACAPHIYAGEQEQPHHVDEMPIPGGELEAEMLFRREVTCDGARLGDLRPGDRLEISAAGGSITPLHPPGYDFFRLLRSKLRWGRGGEHQGEDRKKRPEGQQGRQVAAVVCQELLDGRDGDRDCAMLLLPAIDTVEGAVADIAGAHRVHLTCRGGTGLADDSRRTRRRCFVSPAVTSATGSRQGSPGSALGDHHFRNARS